MTGREGCARRLRWVRVAAACLSCALLSAPSVGALELGAPQSATSVEVHGFVGQGYFLTVGNEWLAAHSTSGSVELSEVGVNFTKRLTERLQVGLQLVAQDLGRRGNYTPQMDWYYVDYHWQDWLGLRAGRMKIPYGLQNELHDIDAARVPILLPQSVYPLQTRQILFAQTGGELYGFARLGALGALDYRVFGGTVFLDAESSLPAGTPFPIEFEVPYTFGGRLLWETPLEGLRVGGSVMAMALDTRVLIPTLPPLNIEGRSWLYVASAEYTLGGLVVTAEYARWVDRQTSDAPDLSPPLNPVSERAYLMATYRLTPWLHPGAYYSRLILDVDAEEGRENVQHDVAATVRLDLNAHWLLKAEGHFMAGTAGLIDPLRVNPPDSSLAERHWGAFFLKTTAYF